MIIALTGMSGSGKTHIARLLSSSCDYKHLSFSTGLKKMFPAPIDQRSEFSHEGKTYPSYKHFLASIANKINCSDPHLFINQLLELLDENLNYVIDDLRTPLQQAKLVEASAELDQTLIVIRVVNPSSYSVSWMDDFHLDFNGRIFNDQLSDDQLFQKIAQIIHSNVEHF